MDARADQARDDLDRVLLATDDDAAARIEAHVRHDPLLAELAPEIAAIDLGTGGGRHKDLLDHCARVTVKVPPRLPVRLAALLHDIGKPATRRMDGREVTFHAHEAVGADIVRAVLPRLGYDPDVVARVATVVEMSGRFKQADTMTDSGVRRFARDAGDALEDLLDLCEVDVTSKHRHKHDAQAAQVARLRAAIGDVAARDAEAARRPVLDGRQVMDLLDVEPGPVIGQALGFLLEHERAHGRPSEDEARRLVLERFATQTA